VARRRQTWTTATKIVDVVQAAAHARVSVAQLGGPIAITRARCAAAQSGLESLFLLIALLSVNVAMLNLLPIPILDGGQILLNIAEAAKGSPFSARTRSTSCVRPRGDPADLRALDVQRRADVPGRCSLRGRRPLHGCAVG
jgi:regulator of sigma E protease